MEHQNPKSLDREDKDIAVAVIKEIITSHTLTEDTLNYWPGSDNKTVTKTGQAVKRMAKLLNRGFYRKITGEVPFFMLKHLQNMQGLLMSECKPKIRNHSFLWVLAVIGHVICIGILLAWAIIEWEYKDQLKQWPKFPISFFVVLIGSCIGSSYRYIRAPKWPADKPIYWPFRTKKLYDQTMENFADKITNPDYLEHHRMAGVYKWLLIQNSDKPFDTERINLLMILNGCPKKRYLPNKTDAPYVQKLPAMLAQVFKKHGDGQNSPFPDMLRRAEFFLTTSKVYGAVKPLYSDWQQLKYTLISVLILTIAIITLSIIKIFPDDIAANWGIIGFTIIGLAMLVSPTIYTNYKSDQQMLKDVVEIPHWPFASQEDFDAAKMEYPHTVYLLEQREKSQ